MTNVLMGECLPATTRGATASADTHREAWRRYASKTKDYVIVVRDRAAPDA
jgi:hypothetical protein